MNFIEYDENDILTAENVVNYIIKLIGYFTPPVQRKFVLNYLYSYVENILNKDASLFSLYVQNTILNLGFYCFDKWDTTLNTWFRKYVTFINGHPLSLKVDCERKSFSDPNSSFNFFLYFYTENLDIDDSFKDLPEAQFVGSANFVVYEIENDLVIKVYCADTKGGALNIILKILDRDNTAKIINTKTGIEKTVNL